MAEGWRKLAAAAADLERRTGSDLDAEVLPFNQERHAGGA